jgi:hypothetical protein
LLLSTITSILPNGLYTPKGNVRLNFVDHGKNFAKGENGMEKLTDKVKQIYDTYANEARAWAALTATSLLPF